MRRQQWQPNKLHCPASDTAALCGSRQHIAGCRFEADSMQVSGMDNSFISLVQVLFNQNVADSATVLQVLAVPDARTVLPARNRPSYQDF